jgi:hypothetical protein
MAAGHYRRNMAHVEEVIRAQLMVLGLAWTRQSARDVPS